MGSAGRLRIHRGHRAQGRRAQGRHAQGRHAQGRHALGRHALGRRDLASAARLGPGLGPRLGLGRDLSSS